MTQIDLRHPRSSAANFSSFPPAGLPVATTETRPARLLRFESRFF
jgi:hypothetical protein